jgi:NLI interacting factor-like phosphatase
MLVGPDQLSPTKFCQSASFVHPLHCGIVKIVGQNSNGLKIVGTCDAAPLAERVLHMHKDTSGQGTPGGLNTMDGIHDDVKKAFEAHASLIRALRTCKWKEPGKSDMALRSQGSSSPSKKLLVLDIDGTLLFSANEDSIEAQTADEKRFGRPHYILPQRSRTRKRRFVWLRPDLFNFLKKCDSLYDVIVFSAAHPAYVQNMVKCIDPAIEYIKHCYTKDHMTSLLVKLIPNSPARYYQVKDLSFLFKARREEDVVLIDDRVAGAALQLENLIPIAEFRGSRSDNELSKLLPFLEDIAIVPDVRDPICKRYGDLWKDLRQPGDNTHHDQLLINYLLHKLEMLFGVDPSPPSSD